MNEISIEGEAMKKAFLNKQENKTYIDMLVSKLLVLYETFVNNKLNFEHNKIE